MADSSRAAVLVELTDGRALPPSELAALAGVSRSTMSEHLALLQEAGFLAVERGGRNRYYRLAGPEVAEAVEALGSLAPRREVRSLKQANRAGALSAARTCYGHLAGRLGVGITAAMGERGLLEREAEVFLLTDDGAAWLGRARTRAAAARRQDLQRLERAPPAPGRKARRRPDQAPVRARVAGADRGAARRPGHRPGRARAAGSAGPQSDPTLIVQTLSGP